MLLELQRADRVQQALALDDDAAVPGGGRLMALDGLNQRVGRGTLVSGQRTIVAHNRIQVPEF